MEETQGCRERGGWGEERKREIERGVCMCMCGRREAGEDL